MKALTEGRYRGRDGIWAVFDLGCARPQLRVAILERDIGRVVAAARWRLSRSIAAGAIAPAGSSRLSRAAARSTCRASPARRLGRTEDGGMVVLDGRRA